MIEALAQPWVGVLAAVMGLVGMLCTYRSSRNRSWLYLAIGYVFVLLNKVALWAKS